MVTTNFNSCVTQDQHHFQAAVFSLCILLQKKSLESFTEVHSPCCYTAVIQNTLQKQAHQLNNLGLIISLSVLKKIVWFINGCCLPRVFLQKQNNAALLLSLCQYKVYFHGDIKEKVVFFIIYFISIIKSQLK